MQRARLLSKTDVPVICIILNIIIYTNYDEFDKR